MGWRHNSGAPLIDMNRTDRLLALVLELRVRGESRAEDLARHFGTSKRTIYRDIQALSEAGVPVVSLMGQGYHLAEGYFLPPLALTEDEATALLLGLSAIDASFDTEFRATITATRRKVTAILAEETRHRVDFLTNGLHLGNMQAIPPAQLHSLRLLRRAIFTSNTVRFRYFSRHPGDGKVSLRDADPYSLGCLNGIWFLSAYCHLRQDRRMFRLSRMEDVVVTAQHYQRPADYRFSHESDYDDRHMRVRLLFDEEVLPWVSEDTFYFIDSREPHPDGLLVTLRVRHVDEVVQWVLGWGRHVRVLEPADLRQRLLLEAQAIQRNHATEEHVRTGRD